MGLKNQYLLVEPVSKTPYPPLGLLKIGSMLRATDPSSKTFEAIGTAIPSGLSNPKEIYITSLFTWDISSVVKCINFYRDQFPDSRVKVGGIAASLMPDHIESKTGIRPHIGLLAAAEEHSPDYNLTFGRKRTSSITFTTRGCIRRCKFCTVSTLEPEFIIKRNWENDIDTDIPLITFWDNNWLASPNFGSDIEKLQRLNKKIDFNQGLDARLLNKKKAVALASLNIDPIRFAFDNIREDKSIIKSITLAKQFFKREIAVYVLYNFNDSPQEFYYKIKLLNDLKVLSFPMCYRAPTDSIKISPSGKWDSYLLRAVKLTLMFYYRRGMITESPQSFLSIYGSTPEEFIGKMYAVYEYDRALKRKQPSQGEG